MILQAFAVHDTDVYTQRIVYMDARKYIGRGVAVMDFLHQIAENILMRIYLHAQVCAIRVKVQIIMLMVMPINKRHTAGNSPAYP